MNSTKQWLMVLMGTTGIPLFGAAVHAQTVPAQGGEVLEEVLVTGLRASIESARAIKQNADTIVDSIVAEDVGKFPDQNIGCPRFLGRL